jgi:N-acetylglucosaminyldiphosphoundecaprenol N-acetyl-beta-D-mannosaminyltransferase
MPLVWIARATGLPIKERVAGSSLFQALRTARDSAAQMRVYFFGGPPGVAETASEQLNAEVCAMRSVGYDSPGFGSIEQMSDAATIARINDSGADFLVVALGAKKGQAWIQHNLAHLRAPLVSHLGAVVNFVAGTVSRAPVWAQKTGLEWLWRIKEEPKLLRRYADDGYALLRLLTGHALPAALAARKRSSGAVVPSTLEAGSGGHLNITLRGVLTSAQRGALMSRLAEALPTCTAVDVVITSGTRVDASLLGALFVMRSEAERHGVSLRVEADEAARRAFQLHLATVLLEQPVLPDGPTLVPAAL